MIGILVCSGAKIAVYNEILEGVNAIGPFAFDIYTVKFTPLRKIILCRFLVHYQEMYVENAESRLVFFGE